ncbi:RNI-like protein [Backusella circina FSU 941]|nr:RNI-like protein [Backusella circina FSU 941]
MAWGGNDGAIDRWEKQLKENDPKLVSLHILSFRKVSTKELVRLFAAMAGNTVLRDLYISGHALDEACADQLSEVLTLNDTLRTLNLGNATLGHDAKVFGLFCEGLAVNEGLIKLDLDNKGLKNDTVRLLAEALGKNEHLKEINLTRNELDDEAMEVLASACTTLEKINLSMNQIGPKGVMALAKDLMPHGAVQELDLSDNPLLDGASQFVDALRQNTTLHVLKMVDVVSSGLDALATLPPPASEASSSDRKLTEEKEDQAQGGERSVHGNALLLALGSVLETNRHLTHVWLNNNSIESSALETLATHLSASSLIELTLRNNLIDDQGALALSQSITRLRQLELGENNITATGFGALLDTSSLHYLGLFGNKVGGFGDAILPELKQSSIKRLDIGCNSIVHKDIEAMVDVLLKQGAPDLEILELGGNVEDKEVELWENTLSRLLSERELEIIWKRKPSQMGDVPPPPAV